MTIQGDLDIRNKIDPNKMLKDRRKNNILIDLIYLKKRRIWQ